MATKVLQNGTILSFDDKTQSIKVLQDSTILIVDDEIVAIGKDFEIPANAEVVDVTGKILTPGFINMHSHLWQSARRTLAPNTTLASYFSNYSQMSPAIKSFSAEDVYTSCLEVYYEGLNGGVTTFVEHASNNWNIEVVKRGYDAAVDGGARVWWCCAVEDREGCSADEQLRFMETMGVRTKSRHTLVKLKLEAITLHNLGGPWPVADNGPNTAAKKGLQDLNVPIVFSHCPFITDTDIDALRTYNWNLSITPESEMHYGQGQKTSRLAQDQASLGVDTNFTFSGDILTQTRLWLQSVRNVSYNNTLDTNKVPKQNPMSVEDAFLLATRQGGQAVRRDDIGVLKVSAKADILCFDGDSANMVGWTDPIAAVVLLPNVGDIKDVMVSGEFRKRDGQLILKDGDWTEFSRKFAEIARRIQRENSEPVPLGDKFFRMKEFAKVETMTTRKQT